MMDKASYPTDVSEAAWALIQPHLPLAKPGGRPRSTLAHLSRI
jgi:transposase